MQGKRTFGGAVSVEAVTALRRAATVLDESAHIARDAVAVRRPWLFGKREVAQSIHDGVSRARTHAQQAVEVLDGLDGRAGQARAGVRTLLDDLDAGLARPAGMYRGSMDLHVETSAGRLQVARDRLRRLADADDLPDDVVRERFQVELDALALRGIHDPMRPDRLAIATLANMPESVRPSLPPGYKADMWETIAAAPEHGMGTAIAPSMYARLELQASVRRVLADTSATRDGMERELRRLLAIPDARRTSTDLRDLSTLASLGDDLRPSAFDETLPYPHARLADASSSTQMLGAKQHLAGNVDALRIHVAHADALAAGTLPTREQAIAEIAAILDAPNHAITREQLRRLSVLARLPGQHRPTEVPRAQLGMSFADVGIRSDLTRDSRTLGSTLDAARAHYHALRDPERVVRDLRAAIDAGEVLDLYRLAAIQGREDLLRAAGISDAMVSEQFARHLLAAGTANDGAPGLEHAIRWTRDRVAAQALPEELEPIRLQAADLADRNLDRMRGVRTDTYGRHPDYAEVGRLAAIARLLETPLGDVPAARATSEALTW